MPAPTELVENVRSAWKSIREQLFKAAIPEGETLPDMDAIRTAFHDEYSEVYDLINSEGFKAGEGRVINKSKKVTEQLKAAEEERDRIRAELEDAQSKAPDVGKIKDDYKRQLTNEQGKAQEREAALKDRLTKVQRGQALASFKAALLNEGLKERAADAYATIYADRFRYTDDDSLEVLQPDSDVPYVVARGNAFDPLVKKIKAEADPDDIRATVDTRGAGMGRQGFGGAPGGGMPRLNVPAQPLGQDEAKAQALVAERNRMMDSL